jgi:hypothetical protein
MERVDPKVRELQVRRFREMSAERKLELAGEMREFAWELRAAELRTRHPGLTEAEIHRRLRQRFPDVAS